MFFPHLFFFTRAVYASSCAITVNAVLKICDVFIVAESNERAQWGGVIENFILQRKERERRGPTDKCLDRHAEELESWEVDGLGIGYQIHD